MIITIIFGFIFGNNVFTSISLADTNSWWALPGQKFVMYENGWKNCSVGFPAIDDRGNHYFLTAGHCFRNERGIHYMLDIKKNVGVNIFSPNNTYTPVGWEMVPSAVDGHGRYLDISLVQMISNRKIVGPGWPHIPITVHPASRNEPACMAGWRSNKIRCGMISQIDIFDEIGKFPWRKLADVGNYCSLAGDSGGAVFNQNGAIGIHSTGLENACAGEFVPIDVALQFLRHTVPSLRLV